MKEEIVKIIILILTTITSAINFPTHAEENTTKSTNLNQKQIDEMVEKNQQEIIKIKNDPKFKDFFDKQTADKKT